jgi:hypothetical protein
MNELNKKEQKNSIYILQKDGQYGFGYSQL